MGHEDRIGSDGRVKRWHPHNRTAVLPQGQQGFRPDPEAIRNAAMRNMAPRASQGTHNGPVKLSRAEIRRRRTGPQQQITPQYDFPVMGRTPEQQRLTDNHRKHYEQMDRMNRHNQESKERHQVHEARKDSALGRMMNQSSDAGRKVGNKIDRAGLKLSHWGDNIRGAKDKLFGGVANLAHKIGSGAATVGRGAASFGRGVRRVGEGVYHVGRDAVHLGRDIGSGIAATYRGTRDLYRGAKKGAQSAMKAYNYMTGDASPEDKVKATMHVAGEGAKMLGRGAAAVGNVGWKAAKGAYNAYVPEERKKQISGAYNAVAKPLGGIANWMRGKKGGE